MNKDEIYEKLKEIIVDQLGINAEEIKLDSTFADDLAADSLDLVELVMEIEERFDISIPDEEAERIITVADIVDYINDHQN